MSYNEPPVEMRWKAVAETERQKAKELRHLHGRGVGTVFVLDVSASMEGDGFTQTKEVFTSVIDEISRNAGSIDESVSVVTFGETVRFVQYPTNNYETLRHCLDDVRCGGSSPLTAGIIVSTAVFNEPGGIRIGDWYLRVRIIVITDGRPTDSEFLDGPDDPEMCDQSQVKGYFISQIHRIGKAHQITFVPTGNTDMSFFEMALGASKTIRVVHASDARQLGKYGKNVVVAARLQKCDLRTVDRAEFQNYVSAATKDGVANDKDIEQISDILNNKDVYRSDEEVLEADEEEQCKQLSSSLIPVGTRVRRGPHWKWRNQDSDGPGTVVGYNTGVINNGWIRVEWDNGVNLPYRYNLTGQFEPIFDIVECHEPRVLIDGDLIAVGCRVTRGPDWKWDEQDGGEGHVGAVYRVDPVGIVHVRWPNGTRSNYRFGYDGMFDVQLCDPFSDHDDMQEKQSKSNMSAMFVTDEFQNNLAEKDASKSGMSNIPSDNSYKSWPNSAKHRFQTNELSNICEESPLAVHETLSCPSDDQSLSQTPVLYDHADDDFSSHPPNSITTSHSAEDRVSSDPADDHTACDPVDDHIASDAVDDQTSNERAVDRFSLVPSPQCTTNEWSAKLEKFFNGKDNCDGNLQNDMQVQNPTYKKSNNSFDMKNNTGLCRNIPENDFVKFHADECNDMIWQWKNPSGKWISYPDDINEIINERYSQNPKGVISVSYDNQWYHFMF